jgi:ribonuclease HI
MSEIAIAMTDLPKIQHLYTDGACSGNPGPGGWGTVVYFVDGLRHEMGGAEANTTNNRMEMQAAIAALKFFQDSGQTEAVNLYTDSEYVKNGITQWIRGWKQKGWKTAAGKAVLNQDLWQQLDALNSSKVKWHYVKGHSGNEGNDRCDAIARAFSLGQQPSLVRYNGQAQSANPTLSSLPNSTSQPTTIQSDVVSSVDSHSDDTPMEPSPISPAELVDDLPREVRVGQLRNLIDTLHIADEIAAKGYLITSSELADLMDINASAVTSRGDNWVWRNWMVSRVRREGNQILWQLERID